MKLKYVLLSLLLANCTIVNANHTNTAYSVASLEVMVDDDWTHLPVITLGGEEQLHVGFDQLSHDYHRYIAKLQHCEPDWSPSEELFESDWVSGFSAFEVEDYEQSINTNELYTHYSLTLPNDQCRPKMSGNYTLTIYDEDNDEVAAQVKFYVVEPQASLSLSVTTNTDISVNNRYQQLSMRLDYGQLNVTFPEEQIKTVVMQNGTNRWADVRTNVRPNIVNAKSLTWQHNRQLIFEGGNEYRKFETLALDHATMGIDRMAWDGDRYHAYPFIDEPRATYSYDESAGGAFLIRNSDNYETERTCDYLFVHYNLIAPQQDDPIFICGNWTDAEDSTRYAMEWDEQQQRYTATILQKQGYYSYRYCTIKEGTPLPLPSEGSFFETNNRYQAFAYYRAPTDRTWRLVAFAQTD